jgi:hypothetical protein
LYRPLRIVAPQAQTGDGPVDLGLIHHVLQLSLPASEMNMVEMPTCSGLTFEFSGGLREASFFEQIFPEVEHPMKESSTKRIAAGAKKCTPAANL